jgi:hypothetical protein
MARNGMRPATDVLREAREARLHSKCACPSCDAIGPDDGWESDEGELYCPDCIDYWTDEHGQVHCVTHGVPEDGDD